MDDAQFERSVIQNLQLFQQPDYTAKGDAMVFFNANLEQSRVVLQKLASQGNKHAEQMLKQFPTPKPPAQPPTPTATQQPPRPRRSNGVTRYMKDQMEDGVEYASIIIYNQTPELNSVEFYTKTTFREEKRSGQSYQSLLKQLTEQGWSEVGSMGAGYEGFISYLERYAPNATATQAKPLPTVTSAPAPVSSQPAVAPKPKTPTGNMMIGGNMLNKERLALENRGRLPEGLRIMRISSGENGLSALSYDKADEREIKPMRPSLEELVALMVKNGWQLLMYDGEDIVYLGQQK